MTTYVTKTVYMRYWRGNRRLINYGLGIFFLIKGENKFQGTTLMNILWFNS